MSHPIDLLFSDEVMITKIKRKLPNLFQIAEIDCTRNGKIGQEVGATREKVLTALLMYKFGNRVDTKTDPSKHGVDVYLDKIPISIKTITRISGYSGVKIYWTADRMQASEFIETYIPSMDLLISIIRWDNNGGLYYITSEQQQDLFSHLGRTGYLFQHPQNTNNRGVEYSSLALKTLIDTAYKSLSIRWTKTDFEYRPYAKWVEQWKME